MAFASRINKALIIQGGKAQMNPDATNNQLFALDLTVPRWEVSSPPWRYLTAPTSAQSPQYMDGNTMVMSPDESQVLLFDRNLPFLSTYNVTTDSWLSTLELPHSIAFGSNYTTAMDPAWGTVYFSSGGINGTTMLVYDIKSAEYWPRSRPLSTQLSTSVQGYSFVYCPSRKSILLFGGKSFTYLGDIYNPYVFEFQMGAYSWVRLNTEGPSPTQIHSHCMVPAYDGFKMVVFGGSTTEDTQLGDIYILDVPTMTWTKGSTPPLPLNRSNMACTVGGDNFVAWGGYNSQKAIDGTPIVYNLRTNQWTTTYSLTSAGSKYNWGAIIGGVGAAIIVAAVVGFVYYRRRKQRKSRMKRVDAQLAADHKRQQQHQNRQEPDAYYARSPNNGTGPSGERGSTHEGSPQYRLFNSGHMSASATSIAPLFARNNSARYSFNSGSSSIQQPPVELYEKGYYVPESTRRNPQFLDAATIPYDDSVMVPVDVLSGEAPWMTPQSSRRNPQLVSEQLQDQEQQHHSLQSSGSVASGGTLVGDDDGERKGDAGRESPPERHLSDLHSCNIVSATLVASSSQILDTTTIISNNVNETTDNTNSNSKDSIIYEQALQQEVAMIHAQQAEYQQNLEMPRLENDRLEQERFAYLDRLAQLQNHKNFYR
ncbi:hypothetical protein EC957_003400 [Mortierella hygrophila]|uniref:Galactose oxidase n=1 Tax=Mortierella hygrophila TaxID=979708 RepID=A0A9P6F1Z9_9FUNG|nr:hypothetical protein EC957_003400 [Mortierella hygrophila]